MWKPTPLDLTGKIYVQIADALARDVASGRLPAGTRLPPQRELALALGVNTGTVTRAYAEATRRGLVEGTVGRGTFVRATLPGLTAMRAPTSSPSAAGGAAGGAVDFGFNLPAHPPWTADISEACAELAGSARWADALRSYHPVGHPRHREAGAAWMGSFGVPATPERTLVCGGGQHGLSAVLAAICSAGDRVACDSVTYPGVKTLARTLHLRLEGLAIDAEGLVPEAFEKLCRREPPRALYLMPSLQNPLGVSLSEARRSEIARIARAHGVALIEDDTYGFLSEGRPTPLVAFAPELTYYVTTLSKSLAPGFRVGYALAPDGAESPARIEALSSTIWGLAGMAAPPMAELATTWMERGLATRWMEWKRDECAARRALAAELLGERMPRSEPRSSHLSLSLPSGTRAEAFASRARDRGVAVTPAAAFAVPGGAPPNAVRVCIGTPPERADVERGLATLIRLMDAPSTDLPSLV